MPHPRRHQSYYFVIRIWLEPREIVGKKPIWRGVIEHAPSGTQRYIKNLGEIAVFLIPFLLEMGVQIGGSYLVLYRLKRLKRRLFRE